MQNDVSEDKLLEARKKKINQQLKRMGCPGEIPFIASHKEGHHEIVGTDTVYMKSQPHYWIITFKTKKPFTGKEGRFTIKFALGMVVIPILNGKFLLKKEFRPPPGKWTWEFPRAFVNLLANEEEVIRNPGGILNKILKNETSLVFESDPTLEVKLLGHSYEDSGMSAIENPFYVVDIKNCTTVSDSGKKKLIEWKLFSLSQTMDLLCENHSHTAMNMLMKQILNNNGIRLEELVLKLKAA